MEAPQCTKHKNYKAKNPPRVACIECVRKYLYWHQRLTCQNVGLFWDASNITDMTLAGFVREAR